jgi:hypothetical protein
MTSLVITSSARIATPPPLNFTILNYHRRAAGAPKSAGKGIAIASARR